MINELIKLATKLDADGFTKEAAALDSVIESYAARPSDLERAEQTRDKGRDEEQCRRYLYTLNYFNDTIIPMVERDELKNGLVIEEMLYFGPSGATDVIIPGTEFYDLNSYGKQQGYEGDGLESVQSQSLRMIYNKLMQHAQMGGGCKRIMDPGLLQKVWQKMKSFVGTAEVDQSAQALLERTPEEMGLTDDQAPEGSVEIEYECQPGYNPVADPSDPAGFKCVPEEHHPGEWDGVQRPVDEPCPNGTHWNAETQRCVGDDVPDVPSITSPVDDLWSAATMYEPNAVKRGGW